MQRRARPGQSHPDHDGDDDDNYHDRKDGDESLMMIKCLGFPTQLAGAWDHPHFQEEH